MTLSPRLKTVAYTVCGSIGLDTSGFSIPYLASWSEETSMEIVETCATWVDQLAKRIEHAVGEPPEPDTRALAA